MNPDRKQLSGPKHEGEMTGSQVINNKRAEVARHNLTNAEKEQISEEAYQTILEFAPMIARVWEATDQTGAMILGALPDADDEALAHVVETYNTHDPMKSMTKGNIRQTIKETVYEPVKPFQRLVGTAFLQNALPGSQEMGTTVTKPDGTTAIVPHGVAPIEVAARHYVDVVEPLMTNNRTKLAARGMSTLTKKGWGEFQRQRSLQVAVNEALTIRPFENAYTITTAVVQAIRPMLDRIDQYKTAMGGMEQAMQNNYNETLATLIGYKEATALSQRIEAEYVARLQKESELIDKFAGNPYDNIDALLEHVQAGNDLALLNQIGEVRAEQIVAPAKVIYQLSNQYTQRAIHLGHMTRIADMRTQIYGAATVVANYKTAAAMQYNLMDAAVTLWRTRLMGKANKRFTDAILTAFQDMNSAFNGQIGALNRQREIFTGKDEEMNKPIEVFDPNKAEPAKRQLDQKPGTIANPPVRREPGSK